jgi:Flp pilus assembly protein TadB
MADLSPQVLAERITNLRDIVNERDHRYEDRFTAMDEKTSLALNSSEKAVTKAEIAQEKRFDNTNEWRAAMQDRDRQQMPRQEIEQRFSAMKTQQNWVVALCVTVVIALVGMAVQMLRH